MLYLLGLSAFIIIMGFLPEQVGLQRNNYKVYLIICGTVVALMAGFRTLYTGSSDTFMYSEHYFLKVGLYDDFRDYYDLYLSEHGLVFSEAGFYGFLWILSRFTLEGRWLIVISSSFFAFSVCRFIHKNSADAPLSLLIYVCLGMYTFGMNGMRQTFAMSICLFAYEYAKKQNIIGFLVTVFTALMFHKSALFFLPAFFIPKMKGSWGNVIVFLVCVIGAMLSVEKLIPWFNDAAGKEYVDDGGTDTGGVSVVLIYIFSLLLTLFVNKLDKKELYVPFLFVLTAFIMYIGRYITMEIIERSSYYYNYFTILLIPAVIKELSPEESKIVRIMFIMGTVALFAYRLYVGSHGSFRLEF